MQPTGPEVTEFSKYLITLGVGGVIAVLIFAAYRKDVKQFTELWKMTTDQLIKVITDNTASNIRLITLLENQERNALRKSDIEEFLSRHISSIRENKGTG